MEELDTPMLPKCVASTTAVEEPARSGSSYRSDLRGELEKEDHDKPGFSNYFKDVEWYG